ncbi:hypothetical protein LWI29_012772 [Acer saccharum]|uniref:DUF1985 domain-containing protein n=1 Tax=Acer saccharum TaxID=4024 RepID=A0AA39W5D0_ACESA|nr:hypothetical protein LWI29_012772 [Acer saccharum]
MWFYIGGDNISRFSIVEFCLVTGLRYSKNNESSHKIDEGLEERIRRIHFNSAVKITVQTLESYFNDYVSMDEEDDDIVKLALLLFLEVTLMGKDERHPVDYVYMQSVDNLDAFNALPWGSSIYKRTFDSLSKCCEGRSEKFKKKREEKPSHKEERYNIYGFVYAFQVWAFETILSYAKKNYAKRISKEIPRILSWEAVKIPTFEDLQNEIFSRQTVPPLRVLKPTEEERQQSFFTELLEHDVPSQDDLAKGVDDLSSEIGSLRLEVVAKQEERTAPENVIIAPRDDKITRELHLFQDELKICKEELHKERENTKKLLNEKVLLEQRISMLEKKKAEEVENREQERKALKLQVENLEQEREALKLQVLELERKLEGATQDLVAVQSTLATKNANLASLHDKLKELEELIAKCFIA